MNPFVSPWLPAFVLLLLACGARLLSKSWLAPSAFVPAIWSGFVLAALFVAPEYPVSSFCIWLIIALVLGLMAGSLCTEEGPKKANIVSRNQAVRRVKLLPIIILFSVLASAGVFYLAVGALNEHDLPYSIGGFLAIGHFLSVIRYSGEQEPLWYRALITWIYPAAVLSGIDFTLATGRRRKFLSLAAFVPGLLVGFFQSERAPTLIAFCLWLGVFFAMKSYLTGGTFHFLRRKLAVTAVGLFLGGICFYVALDAIRTHQQQTDFIVEADWARVKASFVGSLSVFSQWANKSDSGPITYGAYTFAGIFDLMGVHPRQQGIFDVQVTLPDGVETNIYSASRGLIQDFSLAGAVLIAVFVGGLAGISYRHSSQGRFEWTAILAAYYAFVCFSPIVSLFTYNGPILALIVCAFVCKVMSKPSTVRGPDVQNVGGALQNASSA
jgi:oligosaccharide repeat unit polymerase